MTHHPTNDDQQKSTGLISALSWLGKHSNFRSIKEIIA